jgi:hypothetical protein
MEKWFVKLKIPCRNSIEARSVSKLGKGWVNEEGIWRPKRSKELSYILGVMKGDGNIYKNRIQFRTIDEIFAKKFIYYLEQLGIHTYPVFIERRSLSNVDAGDVYCVFASHMLFANWYSNLSLDNLKTEVCEFPEEFICGFYESEGSIYDNQGYMRLRINNTDKDLLYLIYEFIRNLGFKPTFGEDKRVSRGNSKPCYYVNLSQKGAPFRFIEIINPSIKRCPRGT